VIVMLPIPVKRWFKLIVNLKLVGTKVLRKTNQCAVNLRKNQRKNLTKKVKRKGWNMFPKKGNVDLQQQEVPFPPKKWPTKNRTKNMRRNFLKIRNVELQQ